MSSRLNPHLSFDGDAREAMEYYQQIFGGELRLATFGEFGTDGPDAAKIMHAHLETPGGYTLMAADVPSGVPRTAGDTVSISVSGDDDEVLRGYWDGLADGGKVTMPLERQIWGDIFGMCVDRFGVTWMVDIAPDGS